jgi:hypothetical protein
VEIGKEDHNNPSTEYWSVLCPPTPICGKVGLKLWNKLQFKCALQQNIHRNVTLASKVTLMKCEDGAAQ